MNAWNLECVLMVNVRTWQELTSVYVMMATGNQPISRFVMVSIKILCFLLLVQVKF